MVGLSFSANIRGQERFEGWQNQNVRKIRVLYLKKEKKKCNIHTLVNN